MAWETEDCPLDYPVKVGGEEYTKVTVRALNGRAMIAMDKVLDAIKKQNVGQDIGEDGEGMVLSAEQAMETLKIVIVEPGEVVDEMHHKDIEKLQAVAGPFLEPALGSTEDGGSDGGEKTET